VWLIRCQGADVPQVSGIIVTGPRQAQPSLRANVVQRQWFVVDGSLECLCAAPRSCLSAWWAVGEPYGRARSQNGCRCLVNNTCRGHPLALSPRSKPIFLSNPAQIANERLSAASHAHTHTLSLCNVCSIYLMVGGWHKDWFFLITRTTRS